MEFFNIKTADVSVVIPCYRCRDSIDRAVKSIFEQTLLPKEVILIDDASGDGTLEVLYALAKQYSGWIKVIEMKVNSGAASARNAGWAVASQPFIAFLDADDSWHPDKICIQYKYMRDNIFLAISGHQCLILRHQEACSWALPSFKCTKIKPVDLIFKSCFSTPTVMLKSDLPFRFVEKKRFAEDFYLWQQIAFSGLPIARIELPLACVHKKLYGEGGLSAQLWAMEKGELDNFMRLYSSLNINFSMLVIACAFSFVKFLRRLIFTWLSKLRFFSKKNSNCV